MSRIQDTASISPQAARAGGGMNDMDTDQFLKLMLAELQNQDPLNPMDNTDLMSQIGMIREIAATSKLTDTLSSVLEGQNLSTASGLIGKEVKALDDLLREVQGVVDRVSIDIDPNNQENRQLRVHIGEHSVKVNNVREIVHPEDASKDINAATLALLQALLEGLFSGVPQGGEGNGDGGGE